MKNIFNIFKKKFYSKTEKKNSNYFGNLDFNSNNNFNFTGSKGCLDGYTNFVYVSVCCDSICKDVVKNGYYFTNENGEKLDLSKIDENIIMPFINGFYSNSFVDIIKIILYHRLLTGNGFLIKEKVSVYSSYKKLHDRFTPVMPYEIKPMISDNGKELLNYELKLKNGEIKVLDIDEVIHFKQNAIFNPFIGVGNITKMRLLAEGELAGQLFNNDFMNNKAFPSVIFSDETPIRAGDFERNSDLIQRKFKASNGKAFYVNGTNFKIHQLNPSYQDMQFLEQKKYNEEAIYELFGCYKLTSGTNRATAEIKRLRYLENTINPIIYDIENTINNQFFKKMELKSKIFFKMGFYKTSDIDNIVKLLNNGIITPNRASELVGEDFDEKNIERSFYYLPANLLPISENLNNEPSKNYDFFDYSELNDPKNVNQIVSYFFKNSRKNKYFQTKFLKKSLLTRNKIENKFILLLKNFFKQQNKRLNKKIIENYSKYKSFNKKDLYNGEDLTIFFSIKNEDKFLKYYMEKLHKETLNYAVEDINTLVKTNISHNSSTMDILKNILGNNIIGEDAKNNINKYTQKRVYDIIIYSINNSLTINEIQSELKNIFNSFESYRTRRIARTETRKAWDLGAVETYKELDVRKVDVVGCTQFEPDSDCGKKSILLTEILNLRFHPNHIGALAPEIEP